MQNIYTKLKEGYAIAKTPEQIAKVREWEEKIDARVANMNRMLDEMEKTKLANRIMLERISSKLAK